MAGVKPKRSQWCGGITSSATAPATWAARACSAVSARPSHTIDEITGMRPRSSSATMRVTSARSDGVSENTSPVWPLVMIATTPSWPASQEASLRSAGSSMRWSAVKGQEMAGMIPR